MRIKSTTTPARPIIIGLFVFVASFLATTFLSHSLTPAYDSRAEDTIYSDFVENPVLSFTITDPTDSSTLSSIDLSTAPNTLVTKTVNLLISTDSPAGYVLSFSDNDEDTALYRDGDSTSGYKIPTLSSSVSESTFPANTWGYSFGTDSALTPIPPLPQGSVLATEVTAGSYTYPFTLGAKVDYSLPSGSYSDTLVFTVVANPAPRKYLQDLTTEQCKSLELEKQYLYYDRRDEKAYTIARLADNNCWMTSNLRLGNEEGGEAITLTSADTNLEPGETFTLPASAGGVWASSITDQAGAETLHTYSNGTAWIEDDLTSSDQSANIKDQTTDGAPSSPAKYIGNYYNWYTATAGTGRYSNTTTNTTHDICPKGWRLPYSGESGEFQHLYDTYNISSLVESNISSITFRSQPFNFILSGRYGDDGDSPQISTVDAIGSAGRWWGSTPHLGHANNAIWYLYIGPTSATNSPNPQASNPRTVGLSVRCIYQPTIEGLDSEVSYMQDMTDTICKATPTPLATDNVVPQATLIDIRGKDGSGTVANPVVDKNSSNYQTYIVRKLADGNCWMVQNLNMTLSTSITLDSTTTDIGNTTPGRTFTPQYNTDTTEGAIWARDGGDVTRSFEPGENIYLVNGVGTGTLNTTTYNYSGYNTTGDPWYHVGNYYNWYAATAGTGTAAMTSGAATDSLCPKGWKLPDNEGNKSFINLLFTAYGLADNEAASSDKVLQAPLNFIRSGDYFHHTESRIRDRGSSGYWWITTPYNDLYANRFSTTSSRVVPQNYNNKGLGLSIRCIAR